MDPARRRATYEDLLKVPDLLIAEILDGELITSPRPASPHARATSVIRGELDPFVDAPADLADLVAGGSSLSRSYM
jgi:hypothetical protein